MSEHEDAGTPSPRLHPAAQVALVVADLVITVLLILWCAGVLPKGN